MADTKTNQADQGTDVVTLVAAYLLLVVAFAFSYTHVVDAVRAWGQPDVAAYGIAAMPEVTVFIGMRKLLAGQASRFVFFVLASAGAFTLAGNLHSAQHTLGGYVAAGWPAYSAVTALVLSGVHGRKARPIEDQAQTATRVTFERQSRRTTVTPPVTQAVTPRTEVIVTPTVTPKADPRPVTPKALTSAPAGSPEVTSWLRLNWDPTKTLTAEVKHAAMIHTGASESTVKRSARALKFEINKEG